MHSSLKRKNRTTFISYYCYILFHNLDACENVFGDGCAQEYVAAWFCNLNNYRKRRKNVHTPKKIPVSETDERDGDSDSRDGSSDGHDGGNDGHDDDDDGHGDDIHQ